MRYEEWMDETEITGTRYDRFLDEWDAGMTHTRVLEWIRAAYDVGREHNQVELRRLQEFEWMYKDLCD